MRFYKSEPLPLAIVEREREREYSGGWCNRVGGDLEFPNSVVHKNLKFLTDFCSILVIRHLRDHKHFEFEFCI